MHRVGIGDDAQGNGHLRSIAKIGNPLILENLIVDDRPIPFASQNGRHRSPRRGLGSSLSGSEIDRQFQPQRDRTGQRQTVIHAELARCHLHRRDRRVRLPRERVEICNGDNRVGLSKQVQRQEQLLAFGIVAERLLLRTVDLDRRDQVDEFLNRVEPWQACLGVAQELHHRRAVRLGQPHGIADRKPTS